MTTPIRPGTDSGAPYDSSSDVTLKTVPEKTSIVEDFIDIFYAPSTVYARRATGSFWMHLLIITVIAGLFAFANRAVISQIFDVEFTRATAKVMADNPRITPEMMATQRNISEKIATFGGYIGTPIIIFLVGALTWLAAKIVSAKVTYQQAVLIVTLAWIPRLVQSLLTTVQMLIMDISNVTSMHSLSFSPARFMDADTAQRQLLGLMGRLDLFTLWVTLLIGIGIAVIGKVPRARAFAAAAIVWAISTLPLLR
jgi:hypothetical protein